VTSAERAADALAWLRKKGSTRVRKQMAGFGIPPGNAYGVPMAVLQQLARRLGHDHTLAAALWATGQYEAARRLAASTEAAPRWVGKGALRELTSTAVQKRLASRRP
jgi:3-methyladenine DNA glycosylase AlkD